MDRLLFKEEQPFMQWWTWLLIGTSLGVSIVLVLNNLIKTPKGSDDFNALVFVLCLVLFVSIVMFWIFIKMKLVVEITENVIRFKFPPLHNKWKQFEKENIERYEIRKYRAIREFGGWGIKSNWRRRNTGYIVKGNTGLQLFLKSGKKILLGTQRKQAIEYAMQKLMNGED